jgi:capsular exopolysaccharide synthesis family protein
VYLFQTDSKEKFTENNAADIDYAFYYDSMGNAEIERLAVKIDSLKRENENHIILITSAIGDEGKSTIASLIARAIARYKDTLLIDFDVHRPSLHRIFNINKEPGLTQVLNSKISFEKVLKKTSSTKLALVTSGEQVSVPNELFTEDLIGNFINQVNSQFQNIIIDSPPLLPVSDPLLLGNFADNIIFVVKAGSTSRYIVQRAITMFNDINIRISGIVINNMNNVLPSYYDYKYYKYKYNYKENGKIEKKGLHKWFKLGRKEEGKE